MSTPPKKPVPPRRVPAGPSGSTSGSASAPPTSGGAKGSSASTGKAGAVDGSTARSSTAAKTEGARVGGGNARAGNIPPPPRQSAPPPRQAAPPARQSSASQRQGGNYRQGSAQQRQGSRSTSTGYRQQPVRRQARYYEPQRRDPFPIVMGGIIGALAMGLVIVIFLLTSGNQTPSVVNPGSNQNTGQAPGVPVEPDRISIQDFKAMYDDPARRPFIVDVRAKQSYDEGHITGSANVPVAETDARIAEFPKDKLIVAYCQ